TSNSGGAAALTVDSGAVDAEISGAPCRVSSSWRTHRAAAASLRRVSGIGATVHFVSACVQRGWKRQPSGNEPGRGTCPGITVRRAPGRAAWGIEANSPSEYGWYGRTNTSWTG